MSLTGIVAVHPSSAAGCHWSWFIHILQHLFYLCAGTQQKVTDLQALTVPATCKHATEAITYVLIHYHTFMHIGWIKRFLPPSFCVTLQPVWQAALCSLSLWLCWHSGCNVVWLLALCSQVEGKWGHCRGLNTLGPPQGGRPASPPLQSHLDVPAHSHGAQTHTSAASKDTHNAQQHAHMAYTPTHPGPG